MRYSLTRCFAGSGAQGMRGRRPAKGLHGILPTAPPHVLDKRPEFRVDEPRNDLFHDTVAAVAAEVQSTSLPEKILPDLRWPVHAADSPAPIQRARKRRFFTVAWGVGIDFEKTDPLRMVRSTVQVAGPHLGVHAPRPWAPCPWRRAC